MSERPRERLKVRKLGDKVCLEAQLSPSISHALYDSHLTGVNQRLASRICEDDEDKL